MNFFLIFHFHMQTVQRNIYYLVFYKNNENLFKYTYTDQVLL